MNREGRQQGATSVYFLFFTTLLFGLLVMATDFGRIYLIQGELQAAADAAALAAAKELAGTVNARLHSDEQLTATFDITTGNDNRYNLRINEIGMAGGAGLQTLVQTDYFATLQDAKQNINGGQSGGITWGNPLYPKYVRVQITAQAPTVFVPALSRALSAFPEVTVSAIAGISTPVCTACGIDGLAVVDQSAGADPLDFGFIPGSFYTLYLTPTQQQASRPPGTLAGTLAPPVPYVLLNHIPAGPPNLGLDHQLFALAAGGLSSAAGLEPAGTVTAGAPDLAFPDLLNNPGLAAPVSQNVLCGLNTRFGVDPTENICSTIVGGELVTLGAYFGADTDAGAGEEYAAGAGLQDYATEYDGNRRRVLTVAVVDAVDTVNVLNFRQFLIVMTPGALVGLIPNQAAGAFRAQYIGTPVPLRCGSIGGPCEITSGVGRTVLY